MAEQPEIETLRRDLDRHRRGRRRHDLGRRHRLDHRRGLDRRLGDRGQRCGLGHDRLERGGRRLGLRHRRGFGRPGQNGIYFYFLRSCLSWNGRDSMNSERSI